jgi:hypothetical protein
LFCLFGLLTKILDVLFSGVAPPLSIYHHHHLRRTASISTTNTRSDEGGSAPISSYNDIQQRKKRAQDDPKFADAGKVDLSGQNDMASKWPQKPLALIMSRK